MSLAGSLETKSDARAGDPREMGVVRDVQFDETGGAQTRHPFGAAFGEIFGGGTLSNCRRVIPNGNELLVMTDDELYSWNAQLSKWVLRDTHLAVSVSESSVAATTGDQVDGDVAELSGTVVYAWTEGSVVYASAFDKTTGSMLVSPTAVSTAIARPRLVALATTILLFVQATATSLTVRAISPTAPATGIGGAGTAVMAANFNSYYDVVRVDGQDLAVGAARRSVTTSYEVFTVTAALSVTASTKARTADGPLAVATIPGGTQTQVVRGNSTNVQGDLLTTATLADVFTGQAIGTVAGTAINQIAVAFSSTDAAGVYTAHAFWAAQETSGAGFTSFGTKRNTVTTANSVGTQSTMVLRNGVASRAFDRGGRVFVWLAFASDSTSFGTGSPLGLRAQLQNTYFLYRDDGTVVSKSVFQVAGGFAPSTGRLPGVTGASDVFTWASARRRKIITSPDHTGYAARALQAITFTFDSGEARRTARLGRTLYASGGIPMQYDGQALTEVGFLVYPWAFATQDSGVAGNIAAGTYSWKSTLRWQNAAGETERSTTATGEQVTLAASRFVIITIFNLFTTRKPNTRPPAIEIWRTVGNAGTDSPFYLVTGQDPNTTTGDNPYIPNDSTSVGPVVNDNLADADLVKREANPENGLVLESLAPPGARIVIATDTRLFLAGVAGDEDAVWYSRERNEGEIASFHDVLRFLVPRPGGDITALVALDQLLLVFRETAIYVFSGPGLNNLGQGQQFALVSTISLDVGAVSHEAVAFIATLGVLFKSRKGWHLLNAGGGGAPRYVGAAVATYDDEDVLSIDVIESQHQVRILTADRMLIWDYLAVAEGSPLGKWAEWTVDDGVHSCMWQGRHVYLTATGPRIEQTSYTGVDFGADVETKWIPLPDLQGAAKVRAAGILGEWRSDHRVRIRVARDWQYDGSGNPVYFDDLCWTPSPTTVGSALQVLPGLSQQSMQAIKVRVTAVGDDTPASLVTTSLDPQVLTDGTVWNATWHATTDLPGELGNRLTMSVAFIAEEDLEVGELPQDLPFDLASPAIIVNDHFTWDLDSERWVEDLNNIGVLVIGAVAVSDLEAAVAAGSSLATLDTADASPTKIVEIDDMIGLAEVSTASFTGGEFEAPTGEALKLTNLALEVGIRQGVNRRLPAEQKV